MPLRRVICVCARVKSFTRREARIGVTSRSTREPLDPPHERGAAPQSPTRTSTLEKSPAASAFSETKNASSSTSPQWKFA